MARWKVGNFLRIELWNGYLVEGTIQTINDYSRWVTITPSPGVEFKIDFEKIKSARIIENVAVKLEEIIYV